MRFQTWQNRWNSLFLRLNQIEARSEDPERIILARYILDRLSPRIPRHLVLRPNGRGEPGPPCAECDAIVHTAEILVACTVCLEVAHLDCWRHVGWCPTCDVDHGTAPALLPVRQLRVS